MPVNPYKEEQKARGYIDDKINLLIKGRSFKELNYLLLLRQCLINFSVSRRMVENFINDFYVETKEIILVDGVLKQNEVQK